MTVNVIKQNKNVRFKLKKKWRFWRSFKKFFLKRRKKNLFSKLRWRYTQLSNARKYFVSLYGSKFGASLLNRYSKKKRAFFNFLPSLETKLAVLLTRLLLARSGLVAKDLIKDRLVLVNNVTKNLHYYVKPCDVITVQGNESTLLRPKYSIKVLSWRRFRWRSFFWKRRKAFKSIRKFQFTSLWSFRTARAFNYFEVNYRIRSGILLRTPLIGEVILQVSSKVVSKSLLKKVYFMY